MNIGGILNRGLSELYLVNPKNPVTFLAKWLLAECKNYEIDNKVNIILNILT